MKYMRTTFLKLVLIFLSTPTLACSISLSNVDGSGLELKSKVPVPKKVADIIESCEEEADGYIISFTSANGSTLKSPRASYFYQINYNQNGFVSLETPYEKTYLTPPTANPKGLEVLPIGSQSPIEGSYSDTLTITISAR